MTVGLIEDEDIIRRGWKKIIEKDMDGFQVVFEASNGMEGTEKILEYRPDIIISDIKMPRMYGLDMVEKIRESQPGAKVLIISGYNDYEYMRQALQNRVDDFLLKPVKRLDFIRIMEKFKEQEGVVRSSDGRIKSAVVRLMIEEIENNLAGDLSLREMASRFDLNYNYLSGKFKEETGLSYSRFVADKRLEKAKELLDSTNLYIYEIAQYCGFQDEKYFATLFKKNESVTPLQYKNRPT